MSYIMVDIESDGPIPGDYSMICFGAVLVDEKLDRTFYGRIKPVSDKFNPEALAISGFSREETETFDNPVTVMTNFKNWIIENSKGRPIFISDNNGFDWMFICWYFHHFINENPFGYSSRRLSDLYCGIEKDTFAKWKHLRKTSHTHNPVDDAMGNAEVLKLMKAEMGLKISLK
ncbi:MAG: 3'-5' exoribonuclease [Winogradskyella sp.]|uniref:3'-5' exoribonuclease domain-containing protein n=1 Tax=Winogradskyella sp. TaxID=1883156 RepID=UPI003858E937